MASLYHAHLISSLAQDTYIKYVVSVLITCDMIKISANEEDMIQMKAVKTHVGRCDSCGEPAAYAQLLSGGRTFRFCEQHVPLLVKKQAEAAEAANKEKK